MSDVPGLPRSGVPQWMREELEKRLPSTSLQQTAGKQMRELVDSPAWGHIVALIELNSERLLSQLEGSRIPEHVEYAAQHGQRAGVRFALGAAEAVLRVAESADRRANESSKLGDG